MTAPYTERLHRRVNWPPGSWRLPDRGRISAAHSGLWESITPRPVKPDRETSSNTFKDFNL